jgi:hypothetical protein
MTKYDVEYKHISEENFTKIQNVISDQNFSNFKAILTEDGIEYHIPTIDVIFKFSKERYELYLEKEKKFKEDQEKNKKEFEEKASLED